MRAKYYTYLIAILIGAFIGLSAGASNFILYRNEGSEKFFVGWESMCEIDIAKDQVTLKMRALHPNPERSCTGKIKWTADVDGVASLAAKYRALKNSRLEFRSYNFNPTLEDRAYEYYVSEVADDGNEIDWVKVQAKGRGSLAINQSLYARNTVAQFMDQQCKYPEKLNCTAH